MGTISNIVALIILIIGLIFIIVSIWRNWKVNRISSWPKVNAQVVYAYATPANGSNRDVIDPRNIVLENNTSDYKLHVTYRYRVEGRDYDSDNIIYNGNSTYNAAQAKALMSQITPGAVIPVYYDPNDHDESYIYYGEKTWSGIGWGIAALIISAIIFYVGNKNKRVAASSTRSYNTFAATEYDTPQNRRAPPAPVAPFRNNFH